MNDDDYLKGNGKWTNCLDKALLFPTKKSAKLSASAFEGEVVPVYLSRKASIMPCDSVWMVQWVCQIRGLSVYGPYFTKAEAESMYVSIRDGQVGDLFHFTDESYGLVNNPIIRQSQNRLGDVLSIKEVRRACLGHS